MPAFTDAGRQCLKNFTHPVQFAGGIGTLILCAEGPK